MLTANFGRKFFLSVKKCRKKQYKSITQITGDFIKKIGEIFKESEKLYETEEKIKLQTQNSATSLVELYIKTYMIREKMSVKGLS